jgi:hypothetical protein
MTWNCTDFERWLDDGRPDGSREAANAHVTGCARCGAALATAHALEEALSHAPAVTAPTGFTDAVMRRVKSPHAATRARVAGTPIGSWWVRAATDPVVASLCVLAALLAWRWSLLWALAAELGPRLAAWVDVAGRWWATRAAAIQVPAVPSAFTQPAIVLGLSFAAAPALMWLSWHLARWSERAVARSFIDAVRTR